MASKAVTDAVEARLGASWTSSVDGTVLPVLGLNSRDQVPADKTAFIVVEYPVANDSQITIGAPGSQVFRESGAFRIIINVSIGGGESQGRGWADELRTLFRGKQFSGVTTWAPTTPVSVDSDQRGAYWQLAFVVPYFADIFA